MTKKRNGKTHVIVYPDWCKGCGICVAFCPKNVFELGPDGKAVVARERECVNCGFCELHCPDFALSVSPKTPEELAAMESQTPDDADEQATTPAETPEGAPEKTPDDTPVEEKTASANT